MTLGGRIKQTRILLGFTQEDLANEAGISRVSVGNYERNSRVPDSNTLMRLAIALNTTTDYLLGKFPTSANPITNDFSIGTIYNNYSTLKDEDFLLEEYLNDNGYYINSNLFDYSSEDIGTDKFTQHLNTWRNPQNQYYTLQKNKESFCVPPEAITELQTNIKRAIEFEWFKTKEKYKDYKPPIN